MMPKDSITSAEGRSPASVGRSSRGEGPATAAGKSLLAQRAIKKVRVLQETLYRAAKENPRRTFGVLYDKVCRWEVLWEAWYRVRRNRGAPGVDGRSIEAIKAQGEVAFIRDIQAALLAKQYRPRAVRRVFIPKGRGRFRALGIPVVQDRVIQGAVRLVIEPIFEANFCEGSYGFRPGRGCRDAIAAIRKWVTYGYSHVIDADVAACFDSIDQKLLLELVQRRVRDKWVLRLIRWWLKAGIMETDQVRRPVRGTPQGGVLSPTLADIALHPLDKYWEQQHPDTKLVRYADDLLVLSRWRPAEAYMPSFERMIARLKLQLSEEKTRIVEAESGFDFLGVHFVRKPTRHRGTKVFCYMFPTATAMSHVRRRVREEIGSDVRRPLSEVIQYLNPILRGWSEYYRWLNSAQHFRKIDKYVVFKLQRWLRRKQQRTRRAFRRPPDEWWWEQGLFRLSGRSVRVW